MSFTQAEYLPFLAAVVALFQFVPAAARPSVLLAASYGFYLHARPVHALLLVASTALDFGIGLGLGRATASRARRALLLASLAGNLGLLAAFKYTGFLAGILDVVLGWVGAGPLPTFSQPALPLGISFYTFQTLSYTIDVYRGRMKPCRDPLRYALYVSFFPQLIAGPIERAGHLLPQLGRLAVLNIANFSLGSRLILWGLIKKSVIADRFRSSLLETLASPEGHDSARLLVTAMGLNAVLYLDFSGYTDIARGSARLFGIKLTQNFRAPFLACSVGEYTRRWHVSLVSWIGDYVYWPLMRGRSSHLRIWRANMTVMALFGLWHGPRWNFVLFASALGVVLSIEGSLRLRAMRRKIPRRSLSLGRKALGWVGTMLIWSLFVIGLFSPDLRSSMAFLRALVSGGISSDSLPFVSSALALLACGLAVHFAGARLDLRALWNRMGIGGRIAAFATGAYLVFRHAVVEPQEFVYFWF